AEGLGGVLNAYTSQDLVAFHITVRAESAPQAIDLLTDFVARPRIDESDLERERGVVIQEINRSYDQPSVVAEYLIDRAAFGEHPLGRTVLGPEENLRSFSRDAVVAFRSRRWAPALGGAFLAGNLDHLPGEDTLAEHFGRFAAIETPAPYEPAPSFAPQVAVEERDTNQSHLRMIYRPAADVSDLARRAALTVYATLLGGSMSSRLFEEIRERRGLCYSVYAADHAFADVPILQLSSGLQSDKCIEAYGRMREIVDELRAQGPTREEFERARTYAAGRLVLAFENSNAVARHAASRAIVFGEEPEPATAIAALDAVSFEDVAEVSKHISEALAVACVGPHTAADFN
ncbi:MAG: insulinase family protein, partial [Acidobacteriota bacterium]|nr:insulinase family protein [Acidobacteriota bacterium]